MTKVKAIISFNAYGMTAHTGEVFEIEDRGKVLDLEKLGWIEVLEHEVTENGVKKVRKVSK